MLRTDHAVKLTSGKAEVNILTCACIIHDGDIDFMLLC